MLLANTLLAVAVAIVTLLAWTMFFSAKWDPRGQVRTEFDLHKTVFPIPNHFSIAM